MKTRLWLLGILLFAFLIRVIGIETLPLYGDELTIIYDSYSIFKTGKDSTGISFPLTFPMGAGRPGGYVYASVPFVALFGPGAIGVRALSVLSGVGIVYLLYFLGKKLFSQKVGLFASMLGAVSLWDISLSRGGFEAHFALFLALLGTVFFIYSKEEKRFLLPWAISWGLAIHTYPTYKLTLPLFFFALFWFLGGFKRVINRTFVISILILAVFALFSLRETFFGISETRFLDVNVFSQEEVREEIAQKVNYERTYNQLPEKVAVFFHNKPIEYLSLIEETYRSNFSLDFLFIDGDKNPRHNPSEMGVAYLIELLLIFLGVVALWGRNRKSLLFLVLWLLVSPIAGAFLLDTHSLRNSFMLPPLILLSASGLSYVIDIKNKRRVLLLSVIAFAWFLQFLFFVERVYFLAPNKFATFWSYPAKRASELAIQKRDDYEAIFISDKIDNVELAYPVYSTFNPEEKSVVEIVDAYRFKNFKNVYVGAIPEADEERFFGNLNKKALYIKEYNAGYKVKDRDEIINLPDTRPALVLRIYEKVFK